MSALPYNAPTTDHPPARAMSNETCLFTGVCVCFLRATFVGCVLKGNKHRVRGPIPIFKHTLVSPFLSGLDKKEAELLIYHKMVIPSFWFPFTAKKGVPQTSRTKTHLHYVLQ